MLSLLRYPWSRLLALYLLILPPEDPALHYSVTILHQRKAMIYLHNMNLPTHVRSSDILRYAHILVEHPILAYPDIASVPCYPCLVYVQSYPDLPSNIGPE